MRLVRIATLLVIAIVSLGGCAPGRPGQPLSSGPLPPISAGGARLLAGGSTFEVRGVNYVHATNADLAKCSALQFGADGNCPWDLAAISADMDRLQALGVNTVRVFLNYYVFGGARATDPTYSMAQPLAHLDSFIAEANRRGIYVLPVLLAKYPQDRFGPDSYATALDLHVRPVVQHLAGRPGLLAWDVFNEPDIGSPVDIHCWDWSNADYPLCFPLANERMRFVKAIHDEVKRLDPQRLVTVSLAFAKNYFEPATAVMRLADLVDFYAFHYYDDDPYDSGRYAAHWYYGKGFPADQQRAIAELAALRLDKPILITELGFPSGPGTKRTLDELHSDLRLALRTARDEQTSGVILWPFQERPEDLVGTLFSE